MYIYSVLHNTGYIQGITNKFYTELIKNQERACVCVVLLSLVSLGYVHILKIYTKNGK